jgi:hypothetical protein
MDSASFYESWGFELRLYPLSPVPQPCRECNLIYQKDCQAARFPLPFLPSSLLCCWVVGGYCLLPRVFKLLVCRLKVCTFSSLSWITYWSVKPSHGLLSPQENGRRSCHFLWLQTTLLAVAAEVSFHGPAVKWQWWLQEPRDTMHQVSWQSSKALEFSIVFFHMHACVHVDAGVMCVREHANMQTCVSIHVGTEISACSYKQDSHPLLFNPSTNKEPETCSFLR